MGGSLEGGTPQGPDFKAGVALAELTDGEALLGHVDGTQIIVIKHGEEVFAVSATCNHYGAPLNEGIVVEGTVRCPWHHARYDIETGLNVGAPGIAPLSCYTVEQADGQVKVTGRREVPARKPGADVPESVVIIGAGAAGEACAETLRREGYEGPITLLSQSEPFTVDRPNLSKDYLAGEAPDEWLPIRDKDYFESHQIDFVQDGVESIDLDKREITLSNRLLPFDALVIATGAEPRQLSTPGADQDHVRTLRSLEDAKRLREQVDRDEVKSAVVIGAGFIGLEAAASLTKQGLEVHVVAPEEVPLSGVVGEEVGRFIYKVHVENGVKFMLGQKAKAIGEQSVTLEDGTVLAADLVVVGVGVEPRTQLAEDAGIEVDDGIVVDARLATGKPRVWAVGDVASYPYRGDRIRVEHWTVARRHGQSVAKDILGRGEDFDDVPFFWSFHWDFRFSYMGHASEASSAEVHGSLEDRDAVVIYRDDSGKIDAVVTIGRDKLSLQAEYLLEIGDQEKLEALIS